MSQQPPRGLFVLIEGLDRSGKTTQLNALYNYLDSTSNGCAMFRFPNRATFTGKIIDRYLKNEIELSPDYSINNLFSENRWESVEYIIHTLVDKQQHIICDRYAYSGVAFASSENLETCMSHDRGLPKPDVIIFLDVDPETQESRGGFGDERYETTFIQKEARQKFMELKEKDRLEYKVVWNVIDANKPIDEISNEIISIINDVLRNTGDQPVFKLWELV
jgi:dTMP kinase